MSVTTEIGTRDDVWVDHYRDFLPDKLGDVTPIPICGIRMVATIGADGYPAISWTIDNPTALSGYQLAGVIAELHGKVLDWQRERTREIP